MLFDLENVVESELDMLDLAWGQSETSRLGCQLKVTRECEGMTLRIPEATNNLY